MKTALKYFIYSSSKELSSIAPSFLSGTKSSLQALHLQYILHNMYTQLEQSLRVFILSILIQVYLIAKPQNSLNFTVLTTICLHVYMYNPLNSSPVFIPPSSLIGQSSALICQLFHFPVISPSLSGPDVRSLVAQVNPPLLLPNYMNVSHPASLYMYMYLELSWLYVCG